MLASDPRCKRIGVSAPPQTSANSLASKLPYLLRLPIKDGLVLKARDTWPRAARVYCHPFEEGWPTDAEILEETRVSSIRRRGPVIDLVLDRPPLARSQFVFTDVKGRPAIFWQTQ